MGRLFWKIFLGFWVTLLLVGGAVGTMVWLYNKERIDELELLVNSPRAEMGVSAIATALQYGGEDAVREIRERRRSHHRRPLPMLIVDNKGQDLLGRPVPKMMIEQARSAIEAPDQGAVQRAVSPMGESYILFVPLPASRQPHGDPYSNRRPIAPLLISLIASFLFSAWLAWYLTRPIRLLQSGARKFAEGVLETRVVPSLGGRKDELADLGKDFDYMAAKIQQLLNDQQRLLNDVSHELRSPLTRLQLAVELSRQQPERKEELISRIEKESQRLDLLVGDLLTLSRLESQSRQCPVAAVEIKTLISNIAEDASFEAEKQEVSLLVSCPDNLITLGHVKLLHRALENCVRNAVIHSPRQGKVEIEAKFLDSQIEITISDQGEGVPREKLEQLFHPFIRINQQPDQPGYGLGLNIAQRAISLHKGTISATNRKGGGLAIRITLPHAADKTGR